MALRRALQNQTPTRKDKNAMTRPNQTETANSRSLNPGCSVATSNNQPANEAEDDFWDGETEPTCPSCGGEGMVEYLDAGPSAWGEDCPSEENHMVRCPNCRGSGLLKDASSC